MRYYIRKITAGSSPPKEEYLCIVNNAVKNLPSDSAKTRDSFPIATNAKRINFLNLTSRSPWSSPIGPKIKFARKHVEDDDFILFAGYIKKGENAEKTVPREIKEELGLDVVKCKYMSSRYHSKKDVLMLNFIVIVEDKPLKINEDEIAEARWCTPDEALQLIRKGTTAEFFLINAVKELKRKI